ncbi:transporter substrate-binding domain-containing protein, partial [Salmonella enterica]
YACTAIAAILSPILVGSVTDRFFSAQKVLAVLMDKQQAITPVAYDSYLNAFTDLKNNRLEGVFGDVAAIGKWLKNNPDYAIMDERASDPDYYGKGLGIAVRKGNDALLQEINAALDKVKASPEYAQMQEKWFTQ